MSIYGPTLETNQEENEQVDHSVYAKKPDVLLKTGGLMHGNIDMTGHKVVNLGDSTYGQDAATMRYVDTYATYLNNNKVNWAGGTMTGLLNMGSFKITNIGDPENDKDAVNKKYVDNLREHGHDLDLDVIGRYLVISKNGSKSYVSLRTKKNIDLSNTYVNMAADGNELDSQLITINSDITTVDNGNNLSIMQLNRYLRITPRALHSLSEPWTFLFSAKFEEPQPLNNSALIFTTANQTLMFIYMMWHTGTFKYAITDTVLTNQNAISIDIDTTEFNHIAFEYVGNKLTLWVNGKSRKSHNVDLGELSDIRIDVQQLGVLSLYNRELSKTEVAEHFVEYQVKNFSNNAQVLI